MSRIERSNEKHQRASAKQAVRNETKPNTDPNWEGKCEVCGQSPVVGDLGLCGPCCFGEADTIGGNW